MNCKDFEERLESIIAKTLADREMEQALIHARECRRCARLLAIATGEIEIASEPAQDRLTRDIMNLTAGSA